MGWILAIVFGFVIIYLFYMIGSRKRILSKLTSYFNGSVSSAFFRSIFNGQYQGLNFSIKLTPAGKNTPPYLIISLSKDCTLHLTIYRENALSHLGEKIGLVHEVKVDDETFDSDFLICSNDQERARIYLSSADIKNAIREIFNDGFGSLKADKKSITIQKPDYNSTSDLAPQKITTVLQRLSVVMKGL